MCHHKARTFLTFWKLRYFQTLLSLYSIFSECQHGFCDFFRFEVLMESLKDRVKAICSARGLSLNRVEMECGVAKGYISKLDRSSPSAAIILRFSEYLGVSTDYLLRGSSPSSAPVDDSSLRFSALLHAHSELLDLCVAYSLASRERQGIICDLLGVQKMETSFISDTA